MFTKLLKRVNLGIGYQMFNEIEFKGLSISIQASVHHKCSPKQNLNNPDKYDTFEVSVFGDIYDIPEFMDKYDLGSEVMFNVPKDKVNELVEYYRNKYGFKYWHDEQIYKNS